MLLLMSWGRGDDSDIWETMDTKQGTAIQSMINAITVFICLLSALGVIFGLRHKLISAPCLIVYSISMLFGLRMYLCKVSGQLTGLGSVFSCGKRHGGPLPHAEQLKHSLSIFIRTRQSLKFENDRKFPRACLGGQVWESCVDGLLEKVIIHL